MRRWYLSSAVLLSVFFLIAVGLQYSGFHAPMYYDSAGQIAEKRHLFQHEGISSVINLFPQRPIPMMTLYLNYLAGGLNPSYFRLVNLLLLACTALVVVWLLDLILDIPGPWNRGRPIEKHCISIFLGLVFLAHPLQIYLTLYIWQRMALMSCLFFYASFACYLAVRTGKVRNRTAGYASCLVLFVCALLSKENSATLPFVFILAEIAFFREGWNQVARRGAVYLLVLIGLVGFVSLIQHPHGNAALGTGIMSTLQNYYADSGLTVTEVALTQCRVLFHYVSVILAPFPAKVQLINPQVVSRSLWEPASTLPAIAAMAIVLGVGLYSLTKRPLLGFGILFFLGNLLPEGLLVPQYAYFGYRASLPMFGLLLIAADVLLAVFTVREENRSWRLARGVVLGLCLGFVFLEGLSTSLRADLWSNSLRFWRDSVDQFPSQSDPGIESKVASHAVGNLAAALYEAGRYPEAAAYYERAIELSPGDARKLASLGAAYGEMGRMEEGKSFLERAIETDPRCTVAYKNLGMLLMKEKSYEQASERFEQALNFAPYDPSLHKALGRVLLARGDVTQAIKTFRQAIELDPASPLGHYELGQALFMQGDIPEASAQFRRAVELQPGYWQGYNALGIAHALAGRRSEAVAAFRQALSINPTNQSIRANLEAAIEELRHSEQRQHEKSSE
ncbi:MAG: tetratricopeptide repeat protein [Desulfomonile tiedjei]|nr:tetratricopeptide repeat protein [Desulfomonile tiedjei]